MGRDSIEPFINYKEKGVFVLGLTSNIGSNDFQKLNVNNVAVYKLVIKLCNSMNKYNNIGLVIGATNDKDLKDVESVSSPMPWLMPGIGFQGGNLEKSLKIGEENFLSIINVSRGILTNKNKQVEDIKEATLNYTLKIRDLI